jgi:hypothetical protein
MAMQNKKLPIRKIVSYLNNDEAEGGGFWLPNIQRPFVWNEEQISRLFDSIMREYPIGTLLVWKTKELLKHRKFIDNYLADLKLTTFYVPDNTRSKLMVLDGQQRLQSLFIGLRGSYLGRELYFDALSGAMAAPEDIRYRFAFKDLASAVWPWVRFKDIVFQTHKLPGEIADGIAKLAPEPLIEEARHLLGRNIERARQEFVNDDNVTYQELDGIDDPQAYRVDDIVEVFIRANSGGTKLGKSDLLFSLLTASWDEADGELEALLEDLNQGGFAFDRDFVLKSCLTVLGKGARYEVAKFRDGKTKEEIIEKWPQLSAAIKATRDFLVSKTYIRSDQAMPSYLALIPLIYFRYHLPEKFTAQQDSMAAYLLRVLITGVFGGSPDNLIDKVVRNIQEQGDWVLSEVYGVIREDGRSLEVSPEVVLRQYYGSRSIHLFFNLWYRDFNYAPALAANGPQIDHIFPQWLLKTVKDVNPDSGRANLLHYRAEQRDQIANCMLLSAEENGFASKSGKPPAEWFARERFPTREQHAEYLRMHLIPTDPALWTLERFDDFIAARKAFIVEKFSYMLQNVKAE